jgi:hypothetical protein
MSKLSALAQNTMDLYFQEYRKDDEFFELYHFSYLCSIAYARVLQDEYEKSYAMNLRETGVGMATISDDWFINVPITISRTQKDTEALASFEATIPCSIFSFRYDRSNAGIKEIIPLNGRCGDFIRTSLALKWSLKLIPGGTPEIFWFPMGKKIYFSNIQCGLSKATLVYIPSLSDLNAEAEVASAVEFMVVQETLNLMFTARQGKPVVDTTSDGNPNAIMETEVNSQFNKARHRG